MNGKLFNLTPSGISPRSKKNIEHVRGRTNGWKMRQHKHIGGPIVFWILVVVLAAGFLFFEARPLDDYDMSEPVLRDHRGGW
jgi:hypothetical protein